MKNLIIIGGAGYCGTEITKHLLKKNWNITVVDTFWFNTKFENHKNLKIFNVDIRDTSKMKEIISGHEYLLHLACISNDSSFELDENLSTSINLHSFEPIVLASKSCGVKRFVFASSSSVYGISSENEVKEDHKFLPLTLYNKYKGLCEKILLKHIDNDFTGTILRPATVCGYSQRQRFDLSVNILTNHAINNKNITVFGGEQIRPNLHIFDYIEICEKLLTEKSSLVNREAFNYGNENMKIIELADIVKKNVEDFFNLSEITIKRTTSDDIRSYHINSDKARDILKLSPKYTIKKAIIDICEAFQNNLFNNPLENNLYFNVKRMKELNIK